MNITDEQVGGTHYKDMNIEPIDYIMANGLNYLEGNVIKYVSRWRTKDGLRDLHKAKHYIQMLIDAEKKENKRRPDGFNWGGFPNSI